MKATIFSFLLISSCLLAVHYSTLDKPLKDTNSMKKELNHKILTPGSGQQPSKGSTVIIHYSGWLANEDGSKGDMFDSSKPRNQPFSFVVGSQMVISGFDEGVLKMKKGEIAEIFIPSQLGYGAYAQGPIPANSNLIFEIELLDIKNN